MGCTRGIFRILTSPTPVGGVAPTQLPGAHWRTCLLSLGRKTPERDCGTLHRHGSTQHERVAPSAPQPPGAGARRRFRSLLARVAIRQAGAGAAEPPRTLEALREYCKANQKLLPWKAGLGGAGGNPTTGKVNCVPTSLSALRPPPPP